MSRLKTFGKYLLMFVAFYIFVTVASIGFIKGTYETMEQNVYSSDEIQIEVDEAKSTFVNGYVKGKLNPGHNEYTHPRLEPILNVTYGCMVYQEQVMQIVRDLAGYSLRKS